MYIRKVASAALVLLLAACGQGSIKSPDFSAQLQSVEVTPDTQTVALGEVAAFKAYAHMTAPPGQGDGEVRDITTQVQWTTDDAEVALIGADGRAESKSIGSTAVTASYKGMSGSAMLDVGAPVVKQLIVRTPSGQTSAALHVGETVTLNAYGLYTDGIERPIEGVLNTVKWNSADPAAVTVDPATGTTVTASAESLSGGVALRAALYDAGGTAPVTYKGLPLTAEALISVAAAAVVQLRQVQWSDDPLPAAGDPLPGSTLMMVENATRKAVAIGQFSDGTLGVVGDQLLTWSITPDDGALATISAAGEVSGKAKGMVTIRATLNANPALNASRAVEITDEACAHPAREDRFTANGWFVPVLCLICSANDAANVIDANDANYATLINNVALLGGETAVNVVLKPDQPAINTGPAPKPVGFLIAIDPGSFPVLDLGLFNQLYVTLHSDPDGVSSVTGVVARSGLGDGGSNALELTLLGLQLVPGLETVKVSFVPPAGVEYRRLRLGNNAGILQANLTKSVRVSNACLGD